MSEASEDGTWDPEFAVDVPPGVLVCSICLFVSESPPTAAVTVINGHAVCESHATDAQDSTEHWRIIGKIRREART